MLNSVSEFIRWHFTKHILKMVTRCDYRGPVTKVRKATLPDSVLIPDAICYCAGVGENIDFELCLVSDYGAHVFAFDPTPRSIQFIEGLDTDADKFTFVPVGLWDSDITLKFFAPDNPEHVSHSIVVKGKGGEYFDAPCKRLSSLMNELGHDHIDLLKMNIEGAEYTVLAAMMADGVKPAALMVAFEGDWALFKAISWTRKLRRYGYQCAGIRNWMLMYARN